MDLRKLVKSALHEAVAFDFIKKIVGQSCKLKRIDHESIGNKTLKQLFDGHDCVAILFNVLHGKVRSPIGHWCLLMKKQKERKMSFFDSLGLGLKKVYGITHEQPTLLKLLRHEKWEDSHVKLQTMGTDFRECGSYCGVRAKFHRMTNKQFVHLIKSHNFASPDETCVLLTLLHYLDFFHIDKQKKDDKASDSSE